MIKNLSFFLVMTFFGNFHLSGQDRFDKQEWLNLDKHRLKELLHNLQYFRTDDPETFTNRFKKLDVREKRDIGFGGKLYICALYGGYTTQWINILAFKNRIAAIEWHIDKSDTAAISLILAKDPKLKLKYYKYSEDHSIKTQINLMDSLIYNGFVSDLAVNLGPLDPNTDELPDSIKQSYEFLLNPLNDIEYGSYCGYGSQEIFGFTSIMRLVNNKRTKLIENILRGGNPAGRLYAIQALSEMESKYNLNISKEDLKVIKLLLDLPITIPACSGCEGYSTTAKDEFGEKFKHRL